MGQMTGTNWMLSLENMSVMVTGAAQGIGKAVALRCAEAGANIVACDINGVLLNNLAAEISAPESRLLTVTGDASNRAHIQRATAQAVEKFGSIEGLVCGGMRRIYAPAEDFPDSDWSLVVEQGLTGYFRCCQEVGRVMLANRRGSIVLVTSIAGQNAVSGGAAYCSVKAGIAGLTRQLGVEWAPRGVRTNAVAPGFTVTEGAQRVMSAAEAAALIPLGSPASPIEVANVCAFLLSDLAGHITAQEITVDGGYTSVRAMNAGIASL